MDIIDEWEVALDALVAALKHLKEMRGKPGEVLARKDHEKAQAWFDDISAKLI